MKLPNGYGSIYKMSGKRRKPWRVSITQGWVYDKTHDKMLQNRNTLGYYATKQEALLALSQYHQQPFDLSCKNYTFQDIYEKWCAEKYPLISRSNQNAYISAYKSCEALHQQTFRELSLAALQEIISSSPKGYPSLLRIKGLYIQLYQYAMKHDICTRDYSRFVTVTKPKTPAAGLKPHHKFEDDELLVLWQHAGSFTVDILLLLIYSGVRVSELLNLRKEQVHLEERYFEVISSKTANGVRIVPIAEKVVPIWRRFLSCDCALAVCTPRGKPVVYRTYQDYFKKEMQTLQMEHRIHDTRHTCISLLTKENVNPTIIKTIVGHSGAMSLTERVYTHLDVRLLIDAINKI